VPRFATLVVVFASLAFVASGCTGILGDFSIAETGGPDGGTDVTEGPDGVAPPSGDGAPTGAHLSVGSSSFDFGTLTTGQPAPPGTIDVTNVGIAPTASLTTALSGMQYSVLSDGCAGMVLAPSATCHIQIGLNTATAGMPMGTVAITDASADIATVDLNANILAAGALTITQQSTPFGPAVIGMTTPAQVFTVTNTGQAASGAITMTLTPTNGTASSEFTMADGCTGKALVPNGTCAVSVTMTPASAGSKSASLIASATPGGQAAASLTGVGVTPGAVTISPSSYTYPTIPVGMTAKQTFTVTNTGGAPTSPLTTGITYGSGTTQTAFAISNDGCSGQQVPAAGTCTIDVTFLPVTYGPKSATLQINGGSTAAMLLGTGQDSVTLSVTKTGNGGGTVAGDKINCGTACSESVTRTTSAPVITLTATPSSTSTFTGWSGGGCSGTGTCVVTMSAAQTVTATFNVTTFTLQVNPQALAGGTAGTVSVSATGAVSCGTNCYTIPINTTATLTETPPSSNAFATWDGDCAGAGSAAHCTVTMTTNRTAIAYFRPAYNLMFYTSTTYDPAALGQPTIATADGYCASRAAAGHLGGTKWLAWLSTSSAGAASRLPSTGGWLRADGKLFATDITSLTTQSGSSYGTVYYPPRVDELGVDNAYVVTVATGTSANGTVSTGNTCNNFTDPTQPSPMLGATTKGTYAWTQAFIDGGGTFCGPSTPFPIYCFEADFTSTPPKPTVPAGARIAFRSTGAFNPGSGIASADALCTSEATSAGLGGTFIALLATTKASATSRLSLSGANWYRPDGVQITSTPADLGNGTIYAPIDVSANGTTYFFDALVYTGGSSAPNQVNGTGDTCLDWTSNSSAVNGDSGESGDSYTYFWNGGRSPCNGVAPVFCVQK
jgi:hypothetical protein